MAMIYPRKLPTYHFGILIFSLAALAFGLRAILQLENIYANYFAGIVTFLAFITVTTGLSHYWRYHEK